MIDEKELREVINYCKEITSPPIKVLVATAELVLSAKLPEKKEEDPDCFCSNTDSGFSQCAACRAHEDNQLIDACRLAIARDYIQKDKLFNIDTLDLAIIFHHAYERLAPNKGYETREETRIFNPESANGKLMIAVCEEVKKYIIDEVTAQAEKART